MNRILRVRITNIGDPARDEVAQLCVRHLNSNVSPRHSLAGFKRVTPDFIAAPMDRRKGCIIDAKSL